MAFAFAIVVVAGIVDHSRLRIFKFLPIQIRKLSYPTQKTVIERDVLGTATFFRRDLFGTNTRFVKYLASTRRTPEISLRERAWLEKMSAHSMESRLRVTLIDSVLANT